jgi:hydrogenase-4 component E
MTGGLVAFVIVILIPLFVATWRTSLLGLALQGALLAWLSLRHETTFTFDSALAVVDLVAVRAVVAPVLLYQTMRRKDAPPRNDVIAPNLFSWAVVVGLVVVAFQAANALVPTDGDAQMVVAVSSTAFVLGLFVLATAKGTFSQIIGALRIENAIALFELGAPHAGDHEAAALRAAMTGILLASVLYYRWYLVQVPSEGEAARPPTPSVVL